MLSAILSLAVDDPELEQLIDGVHEEMLLQEPMLSTDQFEEIQAMVQDLLS
jgi:hypothetical protein